MVRSFAANQKASSEKQKVSSKEQKASCKKCWVCVDKLAKCSTVTERLFLVHQNLRRPSVILVWQPLYLPRLLLHACLPLSHHALKVPGKVEEKQAANC